MEPVPKELEGFKYVRECKLPSCPVVFGTNKAWQHFHEDECRLAYHRLLRRSHDELIVEIAELKERVAVLENLHRAELPEGGSVIRSRG